MTKHESVVRDCTWIANETSSELRKLAKFIRLSPHLLTDPADKGLAADMLERTASQVSELPAMLQPRKRNITPQRSDMNRKHTPGPYRRGGGNMVESKLHPVWKNDDGWRVVGFAQDCTPSKDFDEREDNQNANCNLFTAAPDMLAVLDAYEGWEADLLMDDEAWRDAETPRLTQKLWDRLLEIQAMRNAAVAIVEGRQH